MSKNVKIKGLFEIDSFWEKEWKDMPEFVQENKTPFRTIKVHFMCYEDVKTFEKLIQQKIGRKQQYLYYPPQIKQISKDKRYIDEP